MMYAKTLLTATLITISGTQLLSGCSSTTWEAVQETWKLSGSGQTDPRLTNDYVRNLPYASLLVAIEPKVAVLTVLGDVHGKQLHWHANNGSVIVTEGGRVVSVEIESVNYRLNPANNNEDPVRNESWQTNYPYRLIMDMPHLGVYQQIFNCQLREQGSQAFSTPLRQGTAKIYHERCTLNDGRFQQDNEYWVDTHNAAVVKAKQHFHPQLSGAIVFGEAKPLGWKAR